MSEKQRPFKEKAKYFKTFYVRENGEATIICPECTIAKTFSVSKFSKHQYRIKVLCSCSNIFWINLDYRRAYRKATNFTGTYHIYKSREEKGVAIVRDLSFRGICFETIGNQPWQIGQEGSIDFTLDNKKQAQLKKKFFIRTINGNKFGCEFRKDDYYQRELGFYLRPGY